VNENRKSLIAHVARTITALIDDGHVTMNLIDVDEVATGVVAELDRLHMLTLRDDEPLCPAADSEPNAQREAAAVGLTAGNPQRNAALVQSLEVALKRIVESTSAYPSDCRAIREQFSAFARGLLAVPTIPSAGEPR
jgi:hypothetical protein